MPVEAEEVVDLLAVDLLGPGPVEVGHRLVASEPGALDAALETAAGALFFLPESACLALAVERGWLVACDEKRVFRRTAIQVLGQGRLLNTIGFFLSNIEPDPDRKKLAAELPGDLRDWLQEHGFETVNPHARLGGPYKRSTQTVHGDPWYL